MSGKLVVRRDDGTVETVAVTGPIRIGSAPQSDLRIESEGVLPLHANAGFEAGEYWIRVAGKGGVAVNGEAAVEKRTLRHLDVITVGPGVNVIFSTTAAPLPAQPRSRRPAAPPVPATPPPPTKMTAVFARPDAAGTAFKPADNTIVGSAPPGVAPKFQPVDADADPANTILGSAPPGIAPKFRPVDLEPNTIVGGPTPAAIPKFDVAGDSTEAPRTNIKGVTFRGIGSVYNAPLGRSVIGRGTTATIRIDSEEVSKVHAFLDVTPSEVTLTDQKSVNGTAVNGTPTPGPRRLIEGDRVSFATFEFRVEFVRMDGSE